MPNLGNASKRLGLSWHAAASICVSVVLATAAGSKSAHAWEPKAGAALPFSTAALNPPDLRVEEAGLPQPLSRADAQRYRQIFALQQVGNWAAADRIIAGLVDRSLVGTILAQRYLHPSAYRSKYGDLVSWLKRYPDHADAPRIHALALSRRPAGAQPPPKPEMTATISNGGLTDYDLDVDFNYHPEDPPLGAKSPAALKLRAWFERALEQERFDAVETRLAGGGADAVLGSLEADGFRSILAG